MVCFIHLVICKKGTLRLFPNFDITPTGDAATPRQPYAAVASQHNMTPYTYPVQFQQAAGLQHYVVCKHSAKRIL